MEQKSKTEIKYYDDKAQKELNLPEDRQGAAVNFLKLYLADRCKNKDILDYGCGNGVYAWWLAGRGGNITAIDLSEKSLEIAKKKAEKESVSERVKFIKMDCEKLDFEDKSFDIVFDGGTFSSLDLNKALPEIQRVLRPEGFLIGIETFGHNPFTNLNRRLNKVLRRGTAWAASHIFKESDFEGAKKYFKKSEIKYFHLLSWIIFPFFKLPGAKTALNILEAIDRALLKLAFLKKYSFKVVFILKFPKL